MAYFVHTKPIYDGYRIELFNEVCTLVCSSLLLILTDIVDNPDIKYKIGYGFIGIYIFNFFINLLVIVVQTMIQSCKKLRILYYKVKYMARVKAKIH
jgi:hypothetical protein